MRAAGEMFLKYRVEIEEVAPEEGSSAVVVELTVVGEIVVAVVVETVDVAEVEETGIVSRSLAHKWRLSPCSMEQFHGVGKSTSVSAP